MDDQKDWWDANQRHSLPEIVDDIEPPSSEKPLSAIIRRRTRPTGHSIQQEIDRRIPIPAAEEFELPIELAPAEFASPSPTESEVTDVFNPDKNEIPTPLYLTEEPVIMAVNANEMGVFQLIRPEPFSGERGSANVDDFLEHLDQSLLKCSEADRINNKAI